jgi:hypothetical protein
MKKMCSHFVRKVWANVPEFNRNYKTHRTTMFSAALVFIQILLFTREKEISLAEGLAN